MAEHIGMAQYRAADGAGLAKGIALAQRMATIAPMSHFVVMHAPPRIAVQAQSEGLFTASLMAAAVQSRPEAHVRLCAFFERHAGKVRHLPGTATPGLVFASGVAYAKAIAAAVPADVPEILTESLTAAAATGVPAGCDVRAFGGLLFN